MSSKRIQPLVSWGESCVCHCDPNGERS